jgi:hypothetical protein
VTADSSVALGRKGLYQLLILKDAHSCTLAAPVPHGSPTVGTVVIADDDAGFRQVVKSMLAGIADRLIEAIRRVSQVTR